FPLVALRPVPRQIGRRLASWLGTKRPRFRGVVSSVLADELRDLGYPGFCADWLERLECVEIRLALGQKPSGGCRLPSSRLSDFHSRILCPNRAVGMG